MSRRTLIAALSVGLAGCAPQMMALRPVAPDEVVEGRGFTFRPPAGPWYALPSRGEPWPLLARTPTLPARSLHTVLALSGVFDGAAPAPEGLWNALRAWIGEYGNPRFTLASERWAPRAQGPHECIRFDVSFVDRGVPGRVGEPFTLRSHGVACRHPSLRDRAVVLTGSERIPPGEAPLSGLDAEFEPLLSSLAFVAGGRPAAIAGIHVGTSPVAATVAFGALWAVGRPGRLVALDRGNTRKLKEFEVGRNPILAVAAGGSLWVLDALPVAALHRVDPATGATLSTVDVPGAKWLAAGDDAIYASGDQGLYRSPASAGAPTLLRSGRLGGVAVRGGIAWVVDRAGGRLLPLDAATGAERGEGIDVGDAPTHLEDAGGSFLVLLNGASKAVVRIDPERRTPPLRLPLDTVPWGACAVGGTIWVTLPWESAVRAFDAKSGELLDGIQLVGARMVCDGEALWMATQGDVVARLVP